MAMLMTRVHVDDYETWKSMFDEGRSTVRERAKGHRVCRAVEDPNELFVSVEFDSVEDAKEARERLIASGALERVAVANGPTIAEEAESLSY
jgi:hypothetical protein